MRGRLIPAVKLVVLIGAFVALPGCQTDRQSRSLDVDASTAGRELLAVLETGQAEQLERYLSSRTDLLGPQALTEDARRFVYDGGWVRRFDPNGKSIVEIVAEGDLEILGALQPDGSIILSFVPLRYRKEARQATFYVQQWMRKYFACRFEKAVGRWQLSENLCFAETDGPYPPKTG